MVFVKEPGTYKIIFDNSFSWFTGKTLRYRLSVLRPLSEIDMQRRVDFEQLKNQMHDDFQNRSQGNTSNRDKLKSESSIEMENKSIHANKILMIKFEGKNRAFKVDNIFHKEGVIKTNEKYTTIPILMQNKRMRILRFTTDEHGMLHEEFVEYNFEEDIDTNNQTLSQCFEKTITEYISKVKYIITS